MKILVCIKQVPESNKVEVDPVTGVLKRDGAASKMNPYDLYALETAFRIREEVGGSVHVISMGPPQAQQVIREAFAMGRTAERFYRIANLAVRMYWRPAIHLRRASRAAAILT